jgi:hypothetical protein
MQIYLGKEEAALLERVSRATGVSKSELIRRAVRLAFGRKSREQRLAGLEASAGSWRERRFNGADYVDAVRGDLNQKLKRLGLT